MCIQKFFHFHNQFLSKPTNTPSFSCPDPVNDEEIIGEARLWQRLQVMWSAVTYSIAVCLRIRACQRPGPWMCAYTVCFVCTVVRRINAVCFTTSSLCSAGFGTWHQTAVWGFVAKRLQLILEMHWQCVWWDLLSYLNSQHCASAWTQPMRMPLHACVCVHWASYYRITHPVCVCACVLQY